MQSHFINNKQQSLNLQFNCLQSKDIINNQSSLKSNQHNGDDFYQTTSIHIINPTNPKFSKNDDVFIKSDKPIYHKEVFNNNKIHKIQSIINDHMIYMSSSTRNNINNFKMNHNIQNMNMKNATGLFGNAKHVVGDVKPTYPSDGFGLGDVDLANDATIGDGITYDAIYKSNKGKAMLPNREQMLFSSCGTNNNNKAPIKAIATVVGSNTGAIIDIGTNVDIDTGLDTFTGPKKASKMINNRNYFYEKFNNLFTSTNNNNNISIEGEQIIYELNLIDWSRDNNHENHHYYNNDNKFFNEYDSDYSFLKNEWPASNEQTLDEFYYPLDHQDDIVKKPNQIFRHNHYEYGGSSKLIYDDDNDEKEKEKEDNELYFTAISSRDELQDIPSNNYPIEQYNNPVMQQQQQQPVSKTLNEALMMTIQDNLVEPIQDNQYKPIQNNLYELIQDNLYEPIQNAILKSNGIIEFTRENKLQEEIAEFTRFNTITNHVLLALYKKFLSKPYRVYKKLGKGSSLLYYHIHNDKPQKGLIRKYISKKFHIKIKQKYMNSYKKFGKCFIKTYDRVNLNRQYEQFSCLKQIIPSKNQYYTPSFINQGYPTTTHELLLQLPSSLLSSVSSRGLTQDIPQIYAIDNDLGKQAQRRRRLLRKITIDDNNENDNNSNSDDMIIEDNSICLDKQNQRRKKIFKTSNMNPNNQKCHDIKKPCEKKIFQNESKPERQNHMKYQGKGKNTKYNQENTSINEAKNKKFWTAKTGKKAQNEEKIFLKNKKQKITQASGISQFNL